MKVLAVDVGTGTQDILLYNARLDLENAYKLVLPSPTMMVYRRLREATRNRQAVMLSGVIMGGGPSAWAAEDAVRAGLPVYATPDAARSFNDDLDAVRASGIRVVSEDEAARLPESVLRVEMRDFDFQGIAAAFSGFGVTLQDLSAIAVAVFDHGNAPPEVSDRKFRFDYLDARIRAENRLSAFAYRAEETPAAMTRLQAVAHSAQGVDAPLVVMDTAPAAVLGATFDPRVPSGGSRLITNVGNFHTLAFRLGPDGIEGVFEHHTGMLDRTHLERLIEALAAGTLTREQVYGEMGHGALVYRAGAIDLGARDHRLVVTGPRRGLLRGSHLDPYFAVPFGDMMISGCFGLLAAVADKLPELSEPILASLRGVSQGLAPWEADQAG
jgi:uncharacterized protein (DUF1786 family)